MSNSSSSSSMDGAVLQLLTYGRVCLAGWLTVYLSACLAAGLLSHITLHLMAVGLLICLLTYYRLPPPNPSRVLQILGPDPANNGANNQIDWEVAHRAACLDGPENSIEALRLAARNGAKMVEFDLSFTSCMSPVVFHDDTLERVTNGTGKIGAWTLSNLRTLCLAAKHPLGNSFAAPVPIPQLEEFVKECLNLKMKMIIDLKTYEIPEETAAEVVGLYRKYPEMRTCTMVTSFFPHLLYRIRSLDPDIICSISYRPHFFAYSTYDGTDDNMRPRFTGLLQGLAIIADMVFPILLDNLIWFLVGLSAVLVHRAVVTKPYVAGWRRRGVRVMAWTVNDPLEKAYCRHVLAIPCLTDTLEKVRPDQWLLAQR